MKNVIGMKINLLFKEIDLNSLIKKLIKFCMIIKIRLGWKKIFFDKKKIINILLNQFNGIFIIVVGSKIENKLFIIKLSRNNFFF